MKFILLFLISVTANAECLNYIARSEVQNAIDMVPDAGSKKCDEIDPCICFDGVYWGAAMFDGKKIVNDQEKLALLFNEIDAENQKKEQAEEIQRKVREGIADANEKETFLRKLAGAE